LTCISWHTWRRAEAEGRLVWSRSRHCWNKDWTRGHSGVAGITGASLSTTSCEQSSSIPTSMSWWLGLKILCRVKQGTIHRSPTPNMLISCGGLITLTYPSAFSLLSASLQTATQPSSRQSWHRYVDYTEAVLKTGRSGVARHSRLSHEQPTARDLSQTGQMNNKKDSQDAQQ